MSSLTGDFPAIFQLSEGTVNRLLASMHQNNWSDSWTPSLPHSVQLRLEAGVAPDGVAGLAQVQVGVPRIELLHGSTDRFRLRVAIRAHYEPDDWAEPLAEFVNGTVTADYVLAHPDPSSPGWGGGDASQYVLARVVDGSVSFDGSLASGWTAADSAFIDPALTLPLVTNQVAELLRTSFRATPTPAPSFGPGRLRSLRGAGGAVVAGPAPGDLGAGAGGGIDSIDEEWLGGRDVGLALSSDFLLSRFRDALAGLGGSLPSVPVDYGVGSTVYRPTVSVAPPEWASFGDWAAVTIRISGSAHTDSVLPDVDLDVVQTVNVGFQPANAELTLTAGQRSVNSRVHAPSPFSDLIEPTINSTVDREIGARIGPLLGSAAAGLNGFRAGADTLGAELRKLDRWLTLRLDEAVFRPDGIVLRGVIRVAARAKPLVTFVANADKTAFTALATWIPGGQVNRLHWTWQWATAYDGITEAKYRDRFLLRGPVQFDPTGIWAVGPLPGLDGKGGVILSVDATVVDERSGELVPVEVPAEAIGFYGYTFPWQLPPWVTRVHWREDLAGLRGDGGPRPQELSLRILRQPNYRPGPTNTLIVTQGSGPTVETLDTLERGVGDHRRPDAGLLTVTLFGEGESARAEPAVVERLGRLESDLDVPLVVAESVDSTLSDGLAIPSDTTEPSYRLIGPGGGATWIHDGALSALELTAALNSALLPSPPPVPQLIAGGPTPGTRLWEAVTDGVAGAEGERHPAPPLGRHADGPSVAMFVDGRSPDSIEQIRNLAQAGGQAETRTVVFVNGGLDEVRALNSRLEGSLDAIPDPGGTIADRLGVGCWPTTMALDEDGAVIASWIGPDATPFSADRARGERRAGGHQ